MNIATNNKQALERNRNKSHLTNFTHPHPLSSLQSSMSNSTMNSRRTPTPEDMIPAPMAQSSDSCPSTESTEESVISSSSNRDLTSDTLKRIREDWDERYNSDLVARKNDFIRQWVDQQIPQHAIESFLQTEENIKHAYDHWVEKQLQLHASGALIGFENHMSFAGVTAFTQRKGMSSPTLDTTLLPSDLFTPVRNLVRDKQGLASVIDTLVQKVTGLERKNTQLSERVHILTQQPHGLSHLQTHITNVQKQVNALMQSCNALQLSQGSETINNEAELLKLTIAGKCDLIEKILGVDITTTGPKPGNLLELLHNRIWYLESAVLTPNARHYHKHQSYIPLTAYAKSSMSAANRTINYATSGSRGGNASHLVNSGGHPLPLEYHGSGHNGFVNGITVPNNPVVPNYFGPLPPSFSVPPQKFEPQDVRHQNPQPQRPHAQYQQHPLQHDPSIPKGPKSDTHEIQLPTDSKSNSAEWPTRGQEQNCPHSSNSRKSSGGQRKQGATKVIKEDFVPRPHSVPLQHPQPNQQAQPVQHTQSAKYQQPNPPQRQRKGNESSMKVFLQTPGIFTTPPAEKRGLCGDECCDFC